MRCHKHTKYELKLLAMNAKGAGNRFLRNLTNHKTSMIPSARPTVPPVAIIIFKRRLFCDILKSGDGRTDIWTEVCGKIMITTGRGRECGSAEWINNHLGLKNRLYRDNCIR